jgi:O-succinylbenzoic acid--CoA ligase
MTEVDRLRDWLAAEAPAPLCVPTSGSTGEPKQVLISRPAVQASAAATAERLGGDGTWILALPTTSIAGSMVIVRSLLAGHEPVGLTTWREAVDAAGSGRRYTSVVPTQLHRALGTPDAEALAELDAVLVGGAGVGRALVQSAESAGITVVSTYGMTETCGGCVYDGEPLDGVRVRIGDDGLIDIAGPLLFDGYRGLPPRSGEWFTTSDLGLIEADGRLRVVGRLDDVVISGGVNVPTRAVVAVLRNQPGVDDIEVLGVPDEEWGERVVAFVVGSVELEALRDAIDPRAWAPRQLVRLAELPRLDSGKVDRVRLRELAG